MIRVDMWTVGPFAENSYLLTCTDTNTAIFIDPGDEAALLWNAVVERKVALTAIVLTHAHLDHIGAVEYIRQKAQVPLYLHPDDNALLASAPQQGQLFGLDVAPVAPADHTLAHGQSLQFGALRYDVLHTPGHSPGSVCLYVASEHTLIAGDTLFYRGIGRTDLPGGNASQLLTSIETQLWPLPESTQVYPGHGPATTIGDEQRLNPFVGATALWHQQNRDRA